MITRSPALILGNQLGVVLVKQAHLNADAGLSLIVRSGAPGVFDGRVQ